MGRKLAESSNPTLESKPRRKPLTAAFVKNAKAPGKYYDAHGLFLFVDKSGARRWYQRITIRNKRTDLGLGSADLITLAEARETALANRKLAREGGDPKQRRADEESVPTFAQAVEKYLAAKLDEFRNERHKKQWRSTLDTYAAPVLGRRPVNTIEVGDVQRVLEPIWSTKTETASRLRGRIEAVLAWATVAGHRSGDNPARWRGNLDAILPKPGRVTKVKNYPALALDDAADWFADLRQRGGTATRALEFVALTAARSGEVRGATWAEFDFEAGLWIVPAERMKMEREHRVPLTPGAVELVKAMPRIDGTEYVFPAARGGMLSDMSLSAAMKRIHEARFKADGKGYVDARSGRPAVPHGLRSTFRDWAAERTEFPGDMAEVALAHRVGSAVQQAYRRGDMVEKRRQMMVAWSDFLRN